MQLKAHPANPYRGFALAVLALALACISWMPFTASAAIIRNSAVLAWNPNPEPDVTGYKVHIGYSSGNYSTVINVVGDTRVTLPPVDPGTTLYLAVSAYNSKGLESRLSAELVVIADVPAPAAATSFAMSSPGQGLLQWKYPKNAPVGAERFTVYASEDLVNWTPASQVAVSESASSDADWLYFHYPYDTAAAPRMFFAVGASNAFGEIR